MNIARARLVENVFKGGTRQQQKKRQTKMDQCPSLLTTLAQFWINLLTPQLAPLKSLSCGNAQTNWTAAKIAKKKSHISYITSSVVASGNVLQVYSHHNSDECIIQVADQHLLLHQPRKSAHQACQKELSGRPWMHFRSFQHVKLKNLW
jgi:hypothetical protein